MKGFGATKKIEEEYLRDPAFSEGLEAALDGGPVTRWNRHESHRAPSPAQISRRLAAIRRAHGLPEEPTED